MQLAAGTYKHRVSGAVVPLQVHNHSAGIRVYAWDSTGLGRALCTYICSAVESQAAGENWQVMVRSPDVCESEREMVLSLSRYRPAWQSYRFNVELKTRHECCSKLLQIS